VQGVIELVARGIGVSVLPRALVHGPGGSGGIAILDLAETWAQRKLLVCRSPQPRTPVTAVLFDAFNAQWSALERMKPEA
jgi:DNA-binding transcriptional LysR family regulator